MQQVPAVVAPTAEPWWQAAPSSAGAVTAPLDPAQLDQPAPDEAHTSSGPTSTNERKLAFAAQRDIGRVRSVNQDSIFGMLATVPRGDGDAPIGVFVVADGMGGHEGGEIASRIAVSTVAQVVLADLIVPALEEAVSDSLQEILTTALRSANQEIWHAAQQNGTDMGTTCTAALLLGSTVYIGHIGDSRAFLVNANGLQQLTSDHSAVGRLIELGQLEPSAAREHPLRSHLYRTVGQTPEVAVDYTSHSVGEASHLLLCSDGLWSMIDDRTILAAFAHGTWPSEICRALIVSANAAGGDDNISAVVVALA